MGSRVQRGGINLKRERRNLQVLIKRLELIYGGTARDHSKGQRIYSQWLKVAKAVGICRSSGYAEKLEERTKIICVKMFGAGDEAKIQTEKQFLRQYRGEVVHREDGVKPTWAAVPAPPGTRHKVSHIHVGIAGLTPWLRETLGLLCGSHLGGCEHVS